VTGEAVVGANLFRDLFLHTAEYATLFHPT
jgi:hypothetical protein